MDFSTKLPTSSPPVLPPPPEHKLVGARKRKPTNISKISSNSASPQKSPHRDDEEENEYEERNCEPNNNKIQSILSELKFAKQRNKLGGGDDVGRGVSGGGRGRFGGSPVFNHFVGGMLEEQDKPTAAPNGLRLPPPPSMIMMPPAHAHVHTTKTTTPTAHFQPPTTRVGGTGSLLQDEPLDLSVDAVDLSKTQTSANLALMMMMMGGSGGERGDKRFNKHAPPTLPSPPPSPPPNIPMDLTRSSTSPRAISKSHYDKVLMIGGKLDTLSSTNLHEYSNDKVSSSFGSPPSSIGSNAQDQQDSSGGNRNVRKYQKRKVDDGGKRQSGGSGVSQGTPPGVKPKQRRYRTERPFHCPHCPARFTLRSNMERHGKHQHATVWQRSPSNRVLNKQRALQAQSQVTHQSSSSSSPPQHQNLSPVSSGNQGGGNNIRMVLSQQLKRKLSNLESADLASVETLLEKTGNEDFKKYFRSVAGDYDDEEDEEMGEEEEEEMDEREGGGGDGGEDLRIDEYDDERFREDFYEEDEVHPHEDVSESRGKRNLRSRTRSNVNSSSQSNVVTQQKSLSAYSSAPHKIACPHCSRKFPWTSSLRRHLLTHTGQKPFQCSHCPLLFTTKSNCDRHVARKHSSEGGAVTITLGDGGDAILRGKLSESRRDEVVEVEEEIEDVEEEEEEEDYDGLVSRIEGKGGKEVEKVGGGGSASFRCHLCELSSSVRSVILKHIESVHSDNFALMDVVGGSAGVGGDEAGGGEEVGVGNVSNRKVLCAFCIRRFWSVEDLRRHMRSHTGERPFSCQYCSRKFTLKHSLIRHSIRHEKNGESQKETTTDDSKK